MENEVSKSYLEKIPGQICYVRKALRTRSSYKLCRARKAGIRDRKKKPRAQNLSTSV